MPDERSDLVKHLGASGPEGSLDKTPERVDSAAATLEEPTGIRPPSLEPRRPLASAPTVSSAPSAKVEWEIVYEAEQEKPVRRKVALKLIKWGMDTRSVVARFESERQALALMNHPNIASVHDAGATDEGRPYFAMECVRGVPITEYCADTDRRMSCPPISVGISTTSLSTLVRPALPTARRSSSGDTESESLSLPLHCWSWWVLR